MTPKIKKILMLTHWAALTIAVLNSFFKNYVNYSLEGRIEFSVEILTAISGLILFFFYLKPFKRINLYFSIYALITFFLIIGLMFRGFFLAVILSLFLSPLIPSEQKFEENEISIYRPFSGFMAPCCIYQVKEQQFLIFEKDYGIFSLEEGPIDFETVKIESNEKEIEITYSTLFDKAVIKKTITKNDNS